MTSTTWYKPAPAKFAHASEVLAKALGGLTKAAYELGIYLFREVIDGKDEEIELYNLPIGIDRTTPKGEGRQYSKETLRKALKQLVNRGLVIIKRNYRGGIFSLTVRHPGERIPFNQAKKISGKSVSFLGNQSENWQTPLSNPHSSVINTENNQRTTDTPPPNSDCTHGAPLSRGVTRNTVPLTETPPHAEEKVWGGGEKNDIAVSVDAPAETTQVVLPAPAPEPVTVVNDPRFEAVAKVAELNPQLRAAVMNFTLEQVLQAIAVLKERQGKVDNPEGFLVKALREGWKPKAPRSNSAPQGFLEWYKLANELDIVRASILENGVLLVYTSDCNWVPWEEAKTIYPLEDLIEGRKYKFL